jgi:hypothetical protein
MGQAAKRPKMFLSRGELLSEYEYQLREIAETARDTISDMETLGVDLVMQLRELEEEDHLQAVSDGYLEPVIDFDKERLELIFQWYPRTFERFEKRELEKYFRSRTDQEKVGILVGVETYSAWVSRKELAGNDMSQAIFGCYRFFLNEEWRLYSTPEFQVQLRD